MSFLQVRNWEQFQHYKDRNPPWIKFYTHLLDDYEISQLPDATQLALLRIYLLAARQNNRLRNDQEWIRQRAGLREAPDLETLIHGGWLEPFGTPVRKSSPLLASDAPVTAASEKERKKERKPLASPEDELPEIAEMRERLCAQRTAEAVERGYLNLVENTKAAL